MQVRYKSEPNVLLDAEQISHIFCTGCSDTLGLSNATGGARICPACQTRLTAPDDAVVTQLNPTEDYKTSVLSGLGPGVIMECAGRGLAFYSYQATQEMWAMSLLMRRYS
jgi:E3 ubiquitin-protein ligase CCNP1IP1